jgi:tripartite-type tricarboxylate transporter receptor subunit TctC
MVVGESTSVMELPRRKFIHLAAGAAALPALSHFARADTYPTRPVRLLVGFPPGGILDVTARLIGPRLAERLGQQFAVENRPGGSGNIATELVAKAEPDGYTLLLSSSVNAWNTTIYDHLSFDFIRDIAPVASIASDAFVMVVNPSFPAKTVSEFIAYAKVNPGKINMAASGPGSSSQLYGELFKAMTGIDLVTVNYRGVGPAQPDIISGRVDVMFDPIPTALGSIKAGKLLALGVTTPKRKDVLPDVPAIGEFVAGYEGVGWEGIGGPANTPANVVAIINKEVNAALADPAFTVRLAELGSEPFATSPAEFGKFIAGYTDKWGKVIRAANIKAE